MHQVRARHPRAAHALDTAEHWIARQWQRLVSGVRGLGRKICG